MSLFIIVPVKQLEGAKSRLASVLPAQERRDLVLTLLSGVLQVVGEAQSALPAQGMVISPDEVVLQIAASHGLVPLLERRDGAGERSGLDALLNAALDQATTWAKGMGADAVLVLPADLPLLTLSELEGIWQASQKLYSARAVIIAPDSRRQGTNALLVRPPGILDYQFGPRSFRRHCAQARQKGLAWHVLTSPRLGLDVDIPADLACYRAVEDADMDLPDLTGEPPQMFDKALEAFLEEPGLLMRLGTLGRDGYPQVTPVWYLYEDGRFYITTASDRVKARNMQAHPKVGFAIDRDTKPYRGVSLWGEAKLVAEGEAARPMTRSIAARYVPAEQLDVMVDSLMQAPRVVFAIEPFRIARMGSWG